MRRKVLAHGKLLWRVTPAERDRLSRRKLALARRETRHEVAMCREEPA
jgi:hypothetical protein